MMDVRMPDGTIIKDVPDGTTQEALQALLKRYDRGISTIPRPSGRISAASIQRRAEFGFPGEPETQRGTGVYGGRGSVPQEFRESVRQRVGDLPPLTGFMTEMAPATAGTAIGAAVGSPLGPPGIVAGAAIGGLAGEFIAQETGVTPKDKAALAITGAAPVAGPLLGGVMKLSRRAVGKGIEKLPPVSAALSRTAHAEGALELESFASSILSRQRGVMSRPSGEIYEAARRSGATIPASEFSRTSKAMSELVNDLEAVRAFPEAEQALKIVRTLEQTYQRTGDPIGISDLIRIRQLLGGVVGKAEQASGVRLGSAKKVFKSLSDDLDAIAKGSSKERRAVRLVQSGAARAKLEFATRDFERAIARFTKDLPGEDAASLDVSALRKWFRDITNPKSAEFDKNFSDALKREIPDIRKQLRELDKFAARSQAPGGAGSIVFRGIGARGGRAMVGAIIGSPGGPVASSIGGFLGASGPEIMAAALTNKTGARMLKAAIGLGKGELPAARWAMISQFVTQLAMGRRPNTARETTQNIEATR